jgi:uncharacterized protein (TIGR02265 family)
MNKQPRMVRGSLFADYVRMLRGFKGLDLAAQLSAEDLALVRSRIDLDAWYPMEAFERLGDVILVRIAGGSLEAVRAWGRITVDQLRGMAPGLVAPGLPSETLTRFHVYRGGLFNYHPIELVYAGDDEAVLTIAYGMGEAAEEAASYQAMGFFERLLELAGARDVRAGFTTARWRGDPATSLELRWKQPG